MANTTYKDHFNDDSSTQSLRASGDSAVQSALDFVASGASQAGHVLEKTSFATGVPADALAQIRAASADAFIHGMDQAMLVGGGALIIAAIVSYFIVDDRVFDVVPEHGAAPVDLVPSTAD
jgi:hypothetical protein